MNTYFITRHQGAIEWAQQQQLNIDAIATHLIMPYEKQVIKDKQIALTSLKKGDTIIGTLPIQIAAQVCAKGATYYHLMLDIPEHLRGKNLSATQMEECKRTNKTLRNKGGKR